MLRRFWNWKYYNYFALSVALLIVLSWMWSAVDGGIHSPISVIFIAINGWLIGNIWKRIWD